MSFRSPPLRPATDNPHRWQTLEPLTWNDPLHGAITVKAGARTDGASIPRLLWTLVGPPMRDSRVTPAAIIHDQLYATTGLCGQLSRASCDAIFYRALCAAGCQKHRAWLYWSGVRLGGWIGWRRYASDHDALLYELAFIDRDPGHRTDGA
jgi:hypothetical protein